MMPRVLYKSIARAALITLPALLLAACGAEPQSTAGAPPEVGVVTLAPQDVVLTTELAGRTTPYLIAEVRPQVGGIIAERAFDEGTDVSEGQILYRIVPDTYQADYDSARAELARDEASLELARLREQRYAELVKRDAVSQAAYDDALAGLKQAKAAVGISRAAADAAGIDLSYTEVRAPISGRVGRSHVTQGALVTANQADELATVQQLDPIYVDVTQSSADLLKLRRALKTGQMMPAAADVDLILEDGTRYEHAGHMQFTEVSVDAQTGTVVLRAVFPNPDRELLPGMYVRAVIREGLQTQALLVSQQAVGRAVDGTPTALVLGPDNTVELRTLTVDRPVGNKWLVSKGLQPGDRVIVDGLQRIRPGAPATPVTVDSTAAHSVAGES